MINIHENSIVIILNKEYFSGREVAKDIESQLPSNNDLEVENWDAFYDNLCSLDYELDKKFKSVTIIHSTYLDVNDDSMITYLQIIFDACNSYYRSTDINQGFSLYAVFLSKHMNIYKEVESLEFYWVRHINYMERSLLKWPKLK